MKQQFILFGYTPLDLLFNAIGILGVATIITAYFLLLKGKIHIHKLPYSLMNFLGASCIFVSVLWNWNLASFLIELIWMGISFYGIAKATGFPRFLKKP